MNYITTPAELDHYGTELFRLMREEKFRVKIHKIYPLSDVARAHQDIESRTTMGKLLMAP
jgi:NADPH2:quinone reductase